MSAHALNLILLRGLPGSGKTTLANILSENGFHPTFSVDDYFTNSETGEYVFDYKNNYLAYKQCEEQTKQSMMAKIPKIIVHNTFTIDWELEIYFKLASEFGYRVFVLTLENYHQGKNTHQINDEQIRKMAEKYKVKLF